MCHPARATAARRLRGDPLLRVEEPPRLSFGLFHPVPMNPLKRGRGDAKPVSHNGSISTASGRIMTVRLAAFNVNGLTGKIDDCLRIVDEQSSRCCLYPRHGSR